MEYPIINQKTIYQGPVFNVRQDMVRLPDGQEHRIDIVIHNPAVTLVPLDGEGMLWFVRQYRHPIGLSLLELPAGTIEANETPQMGALRELREETGMAADRLNEIGQIYLAPGYSTERIHVFLATNLYPSPLHGDQDEFLSIEKVPLAHAYHLTETGQLSDAKSITALTLARRHLDH